MSTTPSQTVGPYLAIGLPWPDGPDVVPDGTPGRIRIHGRVFDGAGDVIPDALIETWQADPEGRFDTDFRGFGRCPTDDEGAWEIFTLKPGRVDRRAGPTHRRQRLRARHAEPHRDPDLLRRRGQRERPGAGHRAGGAPRDADRRAAMATATGSTSTSKVRVKPSSSSSEDVFAGVLARGGVAEQVSGRAWLQALLDFEAALARAQAQAGEHHGRAGRRDRRAVRRRPLRRGRDRRGSGRDRQPRGCRRQGAEGRRRTRRCTRTRRARTPWTPRRCSSPSARSSRSCTICAARPTPRRSSPRRTATRRSSAARCSSRPSRRRSA